MSARNLRKTIGALRDEGVTVFLTTHYLEEAERLCDHVAIIVKGHIVALDTVAGLRSGRQPKTVVEMTLSDSDGQRKKKRVECDDGIESAVQHLLSETDGQRVLSIDTLRPSLEEVFVQLTGLSAEVMLSEKRRKRR